MQEQVRPPCKHIEPLLLHGGFRTPENDESIDTWLLVLPIAVSSNIERRREGSTTKLVMYVLCTNAQNALIDELRSLSRIWSMRTALLYVPMGRRAPQQKCGRRLVAISRT